MRRGFAFWRRDAGQHAIDRTAADWVARQAGGLDETETDRLERWLAADRRHAAAFHELTGTWRTMDRIGEIGLADGAAPGFDLAAAPELRQRRGLQFAFAGAMLAVLGVLFVTHRAFETVDAPAPGVIRTEVGGFRTVTLADGTTVQLNTDSEIEVAFTAAARRVTLRRGEALFHVAHDTARPFFVQAGHVDVRAVGTMFNVRLRPEAVEVLVTEGKVRVADNEAAAATADPTVPGQFLTAGQSLRIALAADGADALAAAAVRPESEDDMARTLAWRTRRLDFVSAPLAEVVAEFNRYNRHKLVIADPALAARRFGGSIRADNGDAFVRLLESRYGVSAEHRAGETVLHLRPDAPGA